MDELKNTIVQLIGRYQREAGEMDDRRPRAVAAAYAALLQEVVLDLREAIGMEDHQHVVWMASAEPPRYEIVGTGLVYDGPPARER